IATPVWLVLTVTCSDEGWHSARPPSPGTAAPVPAGDAGAVPPCPCAGCVVFPAAGVLAACGVVAEAQPASKPPATAATASRAARRPRARPGTRPGPTKPGPAEPEPAEPEPAEPGPGEPGPGKVQSIRMSPHCRQMIAISNHHLSPQHTPADTPSV